MDIAQKYIEGEPEVGTTGVYMDDSSSPEQPDIKPETVVTRAAEVQAVNAQEVNAQVINAQAINAQAMNTQSMKVQAMNAQAMNTQAMNAQVTKVQGMGNEDISQNEGTVYYDVRFNAIAPSTDCLLYTSPSPRDCS